MDWTGATYLLATPQCAVPMRASARNITWVRATQVHALASTFWPQPTRPNPPRRTTSQLQPITAACDVPIHCENVTSTQNFQFRDPQHTKIPRLVRLTRLHREVRHTVALPVFEVVANLQAAMPKKISTLPLKVQSSYLQGII